MKIKDSFLGMTVLIFCLVNCNDKIENKGETNIEFLENKILIQKNSDTQKGKISTNEAIKLAEIQFAKYLPKILESHNSYLDSQDTFAGDFTGDGITDVAIYFSLAPKEGGNTIVGQGLTLYQNTGTDTKVIAGYDPDYLFAFKKISNGKIFINKIEYSETDPKCCPSITTEHILKISGGKAY